MVAQEKRSQRLSKIKAIATALAKLHANGLLPVEDFKMETEDQSEKKVRLDLDTDQRAIMTGIMLDAYGKSLIRKGNYIGALQVLTIVEEVFSLCDPKALELIDNIPVLQINMVWCYLMIGDISLLPEAGKRLGMAREGLERAYGKYASCQRILHGGRYPELTMHLRLELLEGVVAYYSGQLNRAKAKLLSAQAKFEKLQDSEQALSVIMSMGFDDRDAKRALRLTVQDLGAAIDFLVEDKAKKAQIQKGDIERRTLSSFLLREQKLRDMALLIKKPGDLQRLKELVSVGFEKEIAAEALRRNETDFQKSLDDLTHSETSSDLQVDIESRKRKRLERDSEIEMLVRMGFERSRVVDAFEAGSNAYEALKILVAETTIASSSGPSKAQNGDVISADNDIDESSHHALADYDVDLNIEAQAIAHYLSLMEPTTAKLATPQQKDEK
ncbi:hypothetical protein Fmac_012894 [Flemingia macrophylla]|uniref:UBA domain-containing protein n=1 Tax=Flemingia macrophylla TaxID=520843 RepID=A0ABD1MSG3_9FABA